MISSGRWSRGVLVCDLPDWLRREEVERWAEGRDGPHLAEGEAAAAARVVSADKVHESVASVSVSERASQPETWMGERTWRIYGIGSDGSEGASSRRSTPNPIVSFSSSLFPGPHLMATLATVPQDVLGQLPSCS